MDQYRVVFSDLGWPTWSPQTVLSLIFAVSGEPPSLFLLSLIAPQTDPSLHTLFLIGLPSIFSNVNRCLFCLENFSVGPFATIAVTGNASAVALWTV